MPKIQPHHTSPCAHPTRSGRPCPDRSVDHHPIYGPVCARHAHYAEVSEGRTSCLMVRLPAEELAAAKLAADMLDISLSDLGRAMISALPLPTPPVPKLDVDAYAELGRIGRNLNQGIRRLHQLGNDAAWDHTREELGRLEDLLLGIQGDMSALRDRVLGES